MAFRFYVGLHHPADAARFDRCMISFNALRERKADFRPRNWIMDSGAFSEISRHGRHRASGAQIMNHLSTCPLCWVRGGHLSDCPDSFDPDDTDLEETMNEHESSGLRIGTVALFARDDKLEARIIDNTSIGGGYGLCIKAGNHHLQVHAKTLSAIFNLGAMIQDAAVTSRMPTSCLCSEHERKALGHVSHCPEHPDSDVPIEHCELGTVD